jgi:hypothetical protein
MSKLSLLKPYITKEQPFGPIDSYEIASDDIEVLKLLFEKQNRIYKSFRDRPSIIMGRRGSGKTSYLRSVYYDKQYDGYVEISTENALEHIASVVQDLGRDAVFTETLWKLWEKTLWTCVLAQVFQKSLLDSGELVVVAEYLKKMNVGKWDSSNSVLWKLLDLYRDIMNHNSKNRLSEILRQFDQRNFEGAKLVAITGLKASGKKIVILMDSLEDFNLGNESVAQAFQGLLKFAGSLNSPKDMVDIRLCLPTELSNRIIEISSNPIKDFNREVKLEWTAKELISICAQRMMYFIGLYYPELIKNKSHLAELTREDAQALIKRILPEKITNQRGYQENSISYILRHTQLLPRHLLILMNSIFKRTGTTQLSTPFPVRDEKIIYGIRQVEERIVKEIFGAFKMIHPTAEEVCKRCLPQLEHVFPVGALNKVYTRFGKAVFHGDSFFDFQHMLIEIGAIGRVIPGADSDLYVQGKYKYTVGHDLTINYDDHLCLHPLFSGIYASDGKRTRPIYPYGSGLEDQDYRNIGD